MALARHFCSEANKHQMTIRAYCDRYAPGQVPRLDEHAVLILSREQQFPLHELRDAFSEQAPSPDYEIDQAMVEIEQAVADFHNAVARAASNITGSLQRELKARTQRKPLNVPEPPPPAEVKRPPGYWYRLAAALGGNRGH